MPCPEEIVRHPGWLDKVKFILRLYILRCESPWYVYLEAGKGALTNLFLTLIMFDMFDLARSLFRPKGLRTRRHGPGLFGRNKKGRSRWGIPEPSDIIASAVDVDGDLKKPKWSAGGMFLWEIDTHLQKHLNFLSFVNMATDFAYDWWSGIITSPEANCDVGRAVASRDDAIVLGGGWHGIPPLTLRVEQSPILFASNHIQVNAGTAIVIAAMKCKHLGGIPGNITVGIGMDIHYPGGDCFAASKLEEIGYEQETDLIITRLIVGPASAQIMHFGSPAPTLLTEIRYIGFTITE
jgi:hypothetical protein